MFGKFRDIFGGTQAAEARRRAREFTTIRRTRGADQADPLIRMEGITKVFVNDKVETHALREVNLTIERGEFVAVKGPSGSGKSTLLSILGLLDTPTDGLYQLNGVDVSILKPSQRAAVRNREVGFIFQYFNLIGDLSVEENVELPLTYHGMPRAERKERVADALTRVDMLKHARQMPAQLSGGQQQRVGVARAVVAKPEVLLADEPTGNLNSEQSKAVMGLLMELHENGSTIALVSHDPRWRDAAQRIVDIFDGVVEG